MVRPKIINSQSTRGNYFGTIYHIDFLPKEFIELFQIWIYRWNKVKNWNQLPNLKLKNISIFLQPQVQIPSMPFSIHSVEICCYWNVKEQKEARIGPHIFLCKKLKLQKPVKRAFKVSHSLWPRRRWWWWSEFTLQLDATNLSLSIKKKYSMTRDREKTKWVSEWVRETERQKLKKNDSNTKRDLNPPKYTYTACSRDCGFESQHQILDGHLCTLCCYYKF